LARPFLSNQHRRPILGRALDRVQTHSGLAQLQS